MGGYPLHGTGPRGVPGPGGAATDENLPRGRGYGSGITPKRRRQERFLDYGNVHPKRWNTVVQYIATRLLMDLCKEADRKHE